MENLKTNWKLSEKSKNPRSQQEIGCEEIENILKTAGFILFFSKKVALSPAIIQNFAGRRGNKSVQPPKNGWTSLQKATWKLVGEIADFRRYNKEKRLWHLFHHSLMEVTTRFELVNEGFADLCLTTMIVVSPSFSELLRVSRMYLLHSTSTRLPTGISPPLGDIIIAHTPLSLQHSRILGRALFLGCSHFSFLYLSKPTILPTIL